MTIMWFYISVGACILKRKGEWGMQKMNSTQHYAQSVPKGIAEGVLTALCVLLLCACVMAWIVQKELAGLEKVSYGAVAAIMTASFIGCAVADRTIQRRMLRTCVIFAAALSGAMTAISVLVFKAELDGAAVLWLLITGGSILYLLIGKHHTKQGKSRKRRKVKL